MRGKKGRGGSGGKNDARQSVEDSVVDRDRDRDKESA